MKKKLLGVGFLFFLLIAKKVWANPLEYDIDYRSPNISIPAEKKQAVINQALTSWPKSKISSHWDYVYNQALSHKWNPAFVIALWLEESGASGVDAYDLGCLGGNRNDIASQLDCLFKRPYANQTFRVFMCKYSGEKEDCYTNSDYIFLNNPHFPTNLGIWYYRLTGDEKLSEIGGGEPDQSSAPFEAEEIISLKDSFASNNLNLNYLLYEEENYSPPAPSGALPSSVSKVQGQSIIKDKKFFSGELNIKEDGKNLPNFQTMEETLSSSLKKLLPEDLKNELAIDSSEKIISKSKHFVYGLDEKGEKIFIEEEGETREVPEEKAFLPSWWSQLIGESKVLCGLFNTCVAPKSLKIKIAGNKEYDPPEGLGNRDSSAQVNEEKINNNVIKSNFTILSFFNKIINSISKFFEGIGDFTIKKEETTTTAAIAETRAIIPGAENVKENASFFKIFLPDVIVPAFLDSPLKVKATYQVSPASEYTLAGEQKLEYQNLGATRRNYCLSLCSQYPAGFNISQIDPLCPSCRPDDYPLEGYGDIPLSQDFCQFQNGVGCHYYDPTASEGCGENQDPVCEGGKCNPYEFYTDDYVKKCGTIPWYGSCRDVNVCKLITFAKNPAGGFGECQYANPNVCVRTDRLEVGKCAAVCNWACCAGQEKK